MNMETQQLFCLKSSHLFWTEADQRERVAWFQPKSVKFTFKSLAFPFCSVYTKNGVKGGTALTTENQVSHHQFSQREEDI